MELKQFHDTGSQMHAGLRLVDGEVADRKGGGVEHTLAILTGDTEPLAEVAGAVLVDDAERVGDFNAAAAVRAVGGGDVTKSSIRPANYSS